VSEREIMTWDIFGVASRELATSVAESGYEPDIILAIARGGLLAAGALGYALAVKNLYTMNVEFYTGVDERLPVPMILPPVPDLVELRFARVLVVVHLDFVFQSLRYFVAKRDSRFHDFLFVFSFQNHLSFFLGVWFCTSRTWFVFGRPLESIFWFRWSLSRTLWSWSLLR
jgi:hypothetical protein